MSGQSGGVAAAFGFRYQYLVTVEVLLDLYEHQASEWAVEVDKAGQDSADILVYKDGSAHPDAAVQVKASFASSFTTIGLQAVNAILERLRSEHPHTSELSLVTNRKMTAELRLAESDGVGNHRHTSEGTLVRFDHRTETLAGIANRLLDRIANIRLRGRGGVGGLVHHILLRQLIDLVHEHGSRPVHQRISRGEIAAVLDESAAVLADASGGRGWGRTFHLSRGELVDRPTAMAFLEGTLPLDSLDSGWPRVAVVSGISGAGKSSVASLFAQQRLEHLAFVVWLDARSEDTLRTLMPSVMEWLGATPAPGDNSAATWTDLLAGLPIPWLVVFDGAEDASVVREWIPASGYGHIIITTRHGNWPPSSAPVHSLDPFDNGEGAAFLRARLGNPAQASLNTREIDSCQALIARLAGWPLAMELAASWIRQHSGGFDDIPLFLDRFDRLDLSDPDLAPEDYPSSASGVIRDLWEALPQDAQTLVCGLGAMGGRAPAKVLSEWMDRLGGDSTHATHDLVGVSLARLIVMDDPRGPHELDEFLSVHDAVLIGFKDAGFPLTFQQYLDLVETLSLFIQNLIGDARFIEASALVGPADQMLKAAVGSPEVLPELLLRTTVLMHNVGMLATFLGMHEIASRWLTVAVNLRQTHTMEEISSTPGYAALQLQTIGALGQAVALSGKTEDLPYVAIYAKEILDHHDAEIARQGVPTVGQALLPLTQALSLHFPDDPSLGALAAVTGASQAPPATRGGQVVEQIQAQMQMALLLAQAERWTAAVDAGLVAANSALESGALVDVMIDELLDIGLGLTASVLRRPHRTPPDLPLCMTRIVTWLDGELELTASQASATTLLRAIALLKAEPISEAIQEVGSSAEATSSMQEGWIKHAEAVRDMLESQWLSRVLPLNDLPPGMSVTRTVDGGDHVNYWSGVDLRTGLPILVFCTNSAVRYSSDGADDPLKEFLIAAGLPDSFDSTGRPRAAEGWTLTSDDNGLVLRDAGGTPWLTTADAPDSNFLAALAVSRVAHAIYADLVEVDPTRLTMTLPAGLVRVVPDPRIQTKKETSWLMRVWKWLSH